MTTVQKTTTKVHEQESVIYSSDQVGIGVIIVLSVVIGTWGVACLIGGLSSVGWSVPEMGRQFLVATGYLKEYETLVDYYTLIKGVEYLIAAAFFVFFPVFYKNISSKKHATVK